MVGANTSRIPETIGLWDASVHRPYRIYHLPYKYSIPYNVHIHVPY